MVLSRHLRTKRLGADLAADAGSRQFEERETENLRRESENFLARKMDEMQTLMEEQRKAGLLLDDGALVQLNVSIVPAASRGGAAREEDGRGDWECGAGGGTGTVKPGLVFAHDGVAMRRARLVKLDWETVPKDNEGLF